MFKPMLAATAGPVDELKFPLMVSPKLDGVRAIVVGGVLMSRSLKPIPNKYVQSLFGREELNGLDGELIFGSPVSPTAFRDTTSQVMSHDKEPEDIIFHVFDDMTHKERPFYWRLESAEKRVAGRSKLTVVPHLTVFDVSALENLEEQWLADGYEGVMLRSKYGTYKYGRATLKEGTLIKLKRFCDSEAIVLGLLEQMHNANEGTKNALGRTERSTAKAGLVGKDTLGAISVRDLTTGVEFEIGSGFDDAERARIWADKASFVGQTIRYKYFPSGSKDRPRFPVYQGIRDQRDMS